MLTQPITDALAGHRRVLLAGCGGGYDIMGALPLIHELRARGPHIWLSPLLNMFWFFDAEAVAADHVFLASLADTMTIRDVVARIEALRQVVEIRDRSDIPL